MKNKSLDIASSVEWIKSGKILVHPTEGIWGLGCDAFNEDAVNKIFKIKRRSKNKSFILLSESLDFLKKYIQDLNKEDEKFLENYWPGPVTFLIKYNQNLPKHLHTENEKIAVRVSNHLPIKSLLNEFSGLMVSTSSNLSGGAIIHDPIKILKFFESNDLAYYDEQLGQTKKPSKIIDLESKSVIRE